MPDLPLKTETILWLFPIFFMIHDFEEIIMMKPWFKKNRVWLQSRFPKIAEWLFPYVDRLSSSAYTFAVAEEFMVLSVFTLLAVENSWYAFWAGLLIAFLIHLGIHIIQRLILGKYLPTVLAGLPGLFYGFLALYWLNQAGYLRWNAVLGWTLAGIILVAANLFFALWLAARFQTWLEKRDFLTSL